MRIRRRQADPDPHRRFSEWLLSPDDEGLPRDVAVHASVCVDCRRQIAAFDTLTGIDLEQAGSPPARAAIIERRLGPAGRVAVTVGGVAAVAALGIGGWRVADGAIDIGTAGETPTQQVLGNIGEPETTLEPSATESQEASRGASPSASPSATPSGTTIPSQPLPFSQPPFSFAPAATQQPTSAPTQSTRPSPRPTRTPAPTSRPPSPSPLPTPQITPAPTPSPTPVPSV